VGEQIEHEDKQRLEGTAAYLIRNLRSLKKLVYLDGHKPVLYRSRMNPSLGRDFEALDPLEWLASMSDLIPDRGQHRTILPRSPPLPRRTSPAGTPSLGHAPHTSGGRRRDGSRKASHRAADATRGLARPSWPPGLPLDCLS
jgi:hypothetical protein